MTCWPGPARPAARLLELDGDDDRIEDLDRERRGAAGRGSARAGRPASGRPGGAAASAWPRRSPPSSRSWRCRMRGSRSRSASETDPAGLAGRRRRPLAVGPDGVDEVEFLLAPHTGAPPRPISQGRLRRRAVPGDAGPRGRPRRRGSGAHVRVRRGRRRRRRAGRPRDRPPAGRGSPQARRCSSSPTCPGRRVRRPAPAWCKSARRRGHRERGARCSTKRAGSASSPGCSPACRTPGPRRPTPRSCWPRPTAEGRPPRGRGSPAAPR